MRSLKTKRQELKYYSRETHFTTSILLAFKIIENTKFPTQQLVCEWGNQYLSPMTLLAQKKSLPSNRFLLSKYTKNTFVALDLPLAPLGELTALPKTP